MKRLLQTALATILLGSLTIQADPLETWFWTPATTYENGQIIGADDALLTTLHCNDTPGEQGPPYEVQIALDDPNAPPSTEDMDPVVQGRAGTYYCASTHTSTKYGSESGFSNEENFIVTAADLGFVPRPPVNLTRQ